MASETRKSAPDEWQATWRYSARRSIWERCPDHRLPEFEFLLHVLVAGDPIQRLYSGLLAASLINSNLPRKTALRYAQHFKDEGVLIKLRPPCSAAE